MVLSYTSSEAIINHGDSKSYTVPDDITITKIYGKFKGITVTSGGTGSDNGDVSGGSSLTFPDPSGGIAYTSYSGTYNDVIWGPGYYYWFGEYYELGAEQSAQFTGLTASGPCTKNTMFTSTNCSHSMYGSYSCEWSNYTETKTREPWFYIDSTSEYSWYGGTLNNGQWGTGTTYNGALSDLKVGKSTTLHFAAYESTMKFGFKLYYEYEYNSPTQLKTMKIQKGATIYTLPLVSTTDPALEYDFLRTQVGSTVYCVDVVSTTDAAASPVRVQKGTSIYAVRKVT
jgi:hypothetical protein